jgi:hypothetical protein
MICNMLGMAVISYTTSMHLLTQVIITSTSNLPNVSIVITLCIQGACESRSHVAMNMGVEKKSCPITSDICVPQGSIRVTLDSGVP